MNFPSLGLKLTMHAMMGSGPAVRPGTAPPGGAKACFVERRRWPFAPSCGGWREAWPWRGGDGGTAAGIYTLCAPSHPDGSVLGAYKITAGTRVVLPLSPLLQSSLLYHNKKERRVKPRLERHCNVKQGADRADNCTGAIFWSRHDRLPRVWITNCTNCTVALQAIVWRKVWIIMCGDSHTSTPLSSSTPPHTPPHPLHTYPSLFVFTLPHDTLCCKITVPP